MTTTAVVETHVHRARDRAGSEAEAFEARVDAYERFHDRVADVPADPSTADIPTDATTARAGRTAPATRTAGTTTSSAGPAGSSGTQRFVGASTVDRCETVRTAFAETVLPESVADVEDAEPLLETIRTELSEQVAVALASTTGTTFSSEVKRGVLAEAESRKREAAVVRRALDREASSLDAAATLVDDVTTWIEEADETPLSELGFDALRERHRQLSAFRDRCDGTVRDRQSTLRATTSYELEAGVRHRAVVDFLYVDFPVDYPVLSTAARLDATCRSCQRAVRDHLVRRA